MSNEIWINVKLKNSISGDAAERKLIKIIKILESNIPELEFSIQSKHQVQSPRKRLISDKKVLAFLLFSTFLVISYQFYDDLDVRDLSVGKAFDYNMKKKSSGKYFQMQVSCDAKGEFVYTMKNNSEYTLDYLNLRISTKNKWNPEKSIDVSPIFSYIDPGEISKVRHKSWEISCQDSGDLSVRSVDNCDINGQMDNSCYDYVDGRLYSPP